MTSATPRRVRHRLVLLAFELADRLGLSARSVSSFSSCSSYCACVHRVLRQPQPAICCSIASLLLDERRSAGIGDVDVQRARRRGRSEKQRRRQLAFAAVVERRVLGQDVALLLEGLLRPSRVAKSNASSTETRPLRSRSAAVVGERLDEELREARLVALAAGLGRGDDRSVPAPRAPGRNAPLELAVLTNATCWVEACRAAWRSPATVRSGPGRLNAACRPSKLPWPNSRMNTSSLGFDPRGEVGERLRPRSSSAARAGSRSLVREQRDVGVGHAVLLLRRVDERRRPLVKLLARAPRRRPRR